MITRMIILTCQLTRVDDVIFNGNQWVKAFD